VIGGEKGIYTGSPGWSPDGKHLIYAKVKLGEMMPEADIWVADADGKNSKKIGKGLSPLWSPDG
jgi:Tol biopolymer transport system component